MSTKNKLKVQMSNVKPIYSFEKHLSIFLYQYFLRKLFVLSSRGPALPDHGDLVLKLDCFVSASWRILAMTTGAKY